MVFIREPCAGCHTVRGTDAAGTLGPDLSDFGSRQWIGSVTVPNTPEQPGRLDRATPSDQAREPHAADQPVAGRRSTPSWPTWRPEVTVSTRPHPDHPDRQANWRRCGRTRPASPASSPPSTTSASACATSTRRFFFFFVAGLMALVMRAQLAAPEQHVLGPQTYNELFTMHGTTMIFLFNTPVLAGFGNYLIPLQLGTRDMAFPRLNAFSYWVFLLGGIFMFRSFFVGNMPDGGWFGYPPLVSKTLLTRASTSTSGVSAWSSSGSRRPSASINFIVTIFKLRAPGMSLQPACRSSCGRCSCSRSWPSSRCPAVTWPPGCSSSTGCSARRSSSPPWAAASCCTSTCSGSGAIRRCTSSSSRQRAWSRRSSRSSPAGRWPATCGWRRRWSPSASSASACGCTTCSPPGMPRAGHGVLLRRQPHHRHPERRAVLRVDRDHVEGDGAARPRRCCSPSASC